jgi:hypothetical protein
MLSGFEIVSGLADGASVMPAKWNRPVFWFRFYEGKISCVSFILAVRDAAALDPPCGIASGFPLPMIDILAVEQRNSAVAAGLAGPGARVLEPCDREEQQRNGERRQTCHGGILPVVLSGLSQMNPQLR